MPLRATVSGDMRGQGSRGIYIHFISCSKVMMNVSTHFQPPTQHETPSSMHMTSAQPQWMVPQRWHHFPLAHPNTLPQSSAIPTCHLVPLWLLYFMQVWGNYCRLILPPFCSQEWVVFFSSLLHVLYYLSNTIFFHLYSSKVLTTVMRIGSNLGQYYTVWLQ